MNLKALDFFIDTHCVVNKPAGCKVCPEHFMPTKIDNRTYLCGHPEHPSNWETTLEIECMYCEVDMGAVNGQGTEGISSSICPKCWQEKFPNSVYPAYKGMA